MYLNNARIRRPIIKDLLKFMAFGTSGPEAVRAELKAWYGRVVNIRAPIISLKLRIIHVCTLTAFCSANYNTTKVRGRQPVVIRSALGEFEAFSGEWDRWRDEHPERSAGNTPTLMGTRKKRAIRLAEWTRLQNNAAKKDRRDIKRSPFNQKRRE